MRRALQYSTAVVATLAVLAIGQEARAAPLTLTQVPGGTVGPQSASLPCVIAATQCQQPAGMGFNNFTSSGAISSYNMYSTTPTANVADGVQGTPYTVAQIAGALGSLAFNIAIDVNTTAAAGETLQLFEVIVNGIVAYNFVGPTVIGGASSNGNGYADWTLSTVDLSSFAAGASVLFHAVWNHASDGGESFFLVPTSGTTIPEPRSLLIFGAGLLGLAALGQLYRRRRVEV